ncbi:MAG TPA: T9SS type A sorting domain-containing protein [Crocinitomix sp.]|nr:T9SS type A sorting domain-containing protein [Crocinitomix sp.]
MKIMKKTLFFCGLLSSTLLNAQSLTVNDTISSGMFLHYYAADTSANEYAGVAGSGVTWDYDNLVFLDTANTAMYLDSVIDMTNATPANQGYYPMATYQEQFDTGIQSFFSNTPDSIITYGFIFNDGTTDNIIRYHNDPLTSAKFPMALGTSYVDAVDGEAIASGITTAMSGSATIEADGVGTLLLAGNSYSNVIRIKTVENISGNVPLVGPVTITRTSYMYYDLSFSKLPIFIYGKVIADLGSFGVTNLKTVWSKDPLGFASLNESIVIPTVSIFPNPATDIVNISTENATSISIINSIGQTIYATNINETTHSIDVSNFANGIYFVEIRNETEKITKKLVIK